MRIGEVSQATGVSTSAIRFYEEAGLLPEPDRALNGYRMYDSSIIDRITFIRAGQAIGLTLAELSEVLQIRDGGEPPCSHVAELIDRRITQLDERIRELQGIRRELVDLSATAAEFDPNECSGSICTILERQPTGSS